MPATRSRKDTRNQIQKLQALIDDPAAHDGEREAARRMLARALKKAGISRSDTAAIKRESGAWGWDLGRVYGSKYEQVRNMTLPEIAKLMREDVKLARKLGQGEGAVGAVAIRNALGAMPREVKVSITSEYFSGGGAIRIRVKNIPADWGFVMEPDRYRPEVMVSVPSPAFAAALDQLREIHRAYNYDGSDAMVDHFDVNYYGHVDYDRPRA